MVVLTFLDLKKLNVNRPIDMKNAIKYCFILGLYTPRRAPTIITGITLALLANTTKGKLTYFIANTLEFIDIN